MTVGDLLEQLQNVPKDAVLVQRDMRERYGYYFHISALDIRVVDQEHPGNDSTTVVMLTGDICTDVPPAQDTDL